MNLALFDFDGTITTKDSLVDFIQFAVGKPSYYAGLTKLSPMLTAYTLKLIPNDIAKERLIGHFFGEWESEKFQQLAEQYSFEKIDTIVRPEAMERVRWHQEQGDHVVIVSASMECWLTGWCKKKNIELISTQLETIDGRLTGRFATKNCYGVEKANRVKEIYNLEEYDHIYAYGDSRGDRELLALANESFYKPFRARKT
jgi:HAD superfamily hydrolase (TIGR01490 family)